MLEEEHDKHYFRSDGNGGFAVSKSVAVLTILVLTFSLLATVVSVTAFGVTNQNKIEYLEKDQIETHVQFDGIEDRQDENDKTVVNIDTRLQNIESSVKELSDDFKEFLKDYQRK